MPLLEQDDTNDDSTAMFRFEINGQAQLSKDAVNWQ
jgi:hypothetical protein